MVIPESPTSGGWFLSAGDFNGDGSLDLFIADHGWDAAPYPGGQLYHFGQGGLPKSSELAVIWALSDKTSLSHAGLFRSLAV